MRNACLDWTRNNFCLFQMTVLKIYYYNTSRHNMILCPLVQQAYLHPVMPGNKLDTTSICLML